MSEALRPAVRAALRDVVADTGDSPRTYVEKLRDICESVGAKWTDEIEEIAKQELRRILGREECVAREAAERGVLL